LKTIDPAHFNLEADDPFLWLEDITGDKALAWVKARNAETEHALRSGETSSGLEKDLRRILDSMGKIPFIAKRGELYYNFWQDEQNPRGLWRRTTLEEYRMPAPAWETVLDIDALGKAEKQELGLPRNRIPEA
jgi:prolyl oligopeptidase